MEQQYSYPYYTFPTTQPNMSLLAPQSSNNRESTNYLLFGGLGILGFILYKKGYLSNLLSSSSSDTTSSSNNTTEDLTKLVASINSVNSNTAMNLQSTINQLIKDSNNATSTTTQSSNNSSKVSTSDWLTLASQALSSIGTTAASIYGTNSNNALASQKAQYDYALALAKIESEKKN